MFAKSTPESRNESRDQAKLIGQLQTSVTKTASREWEAFLASRLSSPLAVVSFGAFIGFTTQLIERINL